MIPMNGWIPCICIAEPGPIIFFLSAKKPSGYDKNISPGKPAMRSLIAYHARGYTVGIHPSWQSGDEEAVLMEEVDELAEITGTPVKYSRQHYIRMNLPKTYRRLIDLGIDKDFSMGYGSANGFRASIASSFYWYDLKAEKKTSLLLFPFCFMDANSFYEDQLKPTGCIYSADELLQKNQRGEWTDGNHLAQ